MTKYLLIFIIIGLLSSCIIGKGRLDNKYMSSQPEVIFYENYVVLKGSSSIINSATVICKVEYEMIINDKTINFYGIEGIPFIGKPKDSTAIKIKSFKGFDPKDFNYYWINPDNSKVRIYPHRDSDSSIMISPLQDFRDSSELLNNKINLH